MCILPTPRHHGETERLQLRAGWCSATPLSSSISAASQGRAGGTLPVPFGPENPPCCHDPVDSLPQERKEKGTVKLKANAKATQKATPKPKPKVQPQLKPELTVKRKVGRPRKTELEKAVAAAERRRAKKMTRSERVETAPKKARMPTGEGPEGETRKASRAKKEVYCVRNI